MVEAGKKNPELISEANNETIDVHEGGRYKGADPDGGVYLYDDEGMVVKTIKQLIKEAGKNLLTGHLSNFLTMRTPAYIHSHMSYLDAYRADFYLMDAFVEKSLSREAFCPLFNMKCIAVS